MRKDLPVYIAGDALEAFLAYCRSHDLRHFALIADHNTYQALGATVAEALRGRGQGWDVLTILLEGDDIIADARYVFQVLLALDRVPRTYLAVGSGTITDITRFVSHRTGSHFISLPTAPSVDGFTSIGAPMVIDGVKTTINCHGPRAVFAHLPTLCAAPRPLIAAGLGDMLAKFTSVADWELGHLLGDETYDEGIAARMREAAWACARRAEAIAAGAEEGIRALMEGLIESGFCMLDFGETRPASGYEHHISHFWEMKLLREGRRSILHGAKVGIGVLVSAARYEAVRQMSRAEAQERLAQANLPGEAEKQGIRGAYGPIADQILAVQAPFFEMSAEAFASLKQRIVERWDQVQRIAASVPQASELAEWLRKAGGPTKGQQVGLSAEEVALGVEYAHYFKPRITVGRLAHWLGLDREGAVAQD